MADSKHRVIKKHSGTGKLHYFPDSVPHVRPVTVDGTAGTKCLCLYKRTVFTSSGSIFIQLQTKTAQHIFTASVFFPAVQAYHKMNYLLLTDTFLKDFFFSSHAAHISTKHFFIYAENDRNIPIEKFLSDSENIK